MESVLAALKVTPIPTIMVIAGIAFLLLSIAVQLAGRIVVPPERQRQAMIIGCILMLAGIALHVAPPRWLTDFGPKKPPSPPPSELTELKKPPDPPPSELTPEVLKLKAIPSLNARLTALRFFEGDPCDEPPLKERTYRQRFAKVITRDIFTEITLEYPKREQRFDFTTQAVYQRRAPQDGEVVSRSELRTYIPAGEQRSIHSLESGKWALGIPVHCSAIGNPGDWSVGSYTVDVYINGEEVASGSFEIHE